MPFHASLSLRECLVVLLLSHPQGLRATACWEALPEPRPAFHTVRNALYQLVAQGIVTRVGHGRYALSRHHGSAAPEPCEPRKVRVPAPAPEAPARPRLYPCPRGCGYLTTRSAHACCRPCIWRGLHPESLGQHSAHCEAQQPHAAAGGPHA